MIFLSNYESDDLCLVKLESKSRDNHIFSHQGRAKKLYLLSCNKNDTTLQEFHSRFLAISQQRSYIKKWFLRQNDQLNMVITATPTMACQ